MPDVNRDNNMTDDLLVKYLLGETSQEEGLIVQAWVSTSEENKRYFDHFKLIWDTSRELASKASTNEEDAWNRFKLRTQQNDKAGNGIPFPRRFSFLKVAAVLIMLIGGGMLYYLMQGNSNNMVAMEAGDAVLVDTLPDGSVVTLNKHAILKYPEQFSGSKRLVQLEGEAFFNVTPDKQKPFIIRANESVVTVVGTSFNVNSSADRTEVIVETGIVEVAKDVHKVKLSPNEKAVVSKDRVDPLKQENGDALYNYYRTQEFVCNATPLWRLVDVLNQAYNTDIVIGNSRLNNLPLTTTFRNEPLDNILVVISETFNIRVEKKDGQIILK